jgi:hypothetical protein
MSPEIIATIITIAAATIGTAISIHSRLISKIVSIEIKVNQLEIGAIEDRQERKEQTQVLHSLALSIQKLSGFLEAYQVGFPMMSMPPIKRKSKASND